jgi:hypothetical protein
MKRLANFPIVISILLLLVAPCFSAELINVTGNGVELTYVSVDCNNENEVGITVTGTGFVGLNISVQNCVAGGFVFNETGTLTNSRVFLIGNDITIASSKMVTGTYNLFGDAAKAGDGTYLDEGSTSKWSASEFVKPSAGLFQRSVPQYYYYTP